MTPRALHLGVALLEGVAGSSLVVEPFRGAVRPLNEREIATGMVRVARGAISTRRAACVKALLLLLEPRDLAMAAEAPLGGGLAASAVTLRAVERTFERGVRFRERPRRDLRRCCAHHEHRA